MYRVRAAGKSGSVRRELAASKRRERLAVTAVFLAVLCCLVAVGGYFAVLRFSGGGGLGPGQNQVDDTHAGGNESGVLRAVVVDALSADGSNGSFAEPVREVLEGEGFRVIRFWNNDVAENVEGVVATIGEALG